MQWSDAHVGQTVYTDNYENGKFPHANPRIAGPFVVHNIALRLLKGSRGAFIHYPDNLLSEEERQEKVSLTYKFEYQGRWTPDYFPGVGTAFTEYDSVDVGIGDTVREAAEDALDSYSQRGLPDGIEIPWEEDQGPKAHADCEPCGECASCLSYDQEERQDRLDECLQHQECEMHVYVALFVKLEEGDDDEHTAESEAVDSPSTGGGD